MNGRTQQDRQLNSTVKASFKTAKCPIKKEERTASTDHKITTINQLKIHNYHNKIK